VNTTTNTLTYKLIDSGDFRKLEQVGPFRIVRPAAGAVWRPVLQASAWKADAEFTRNAGGDGQWSVANPKVRTGWQIEACGARLLIKITDFGHLGIFPEQHANWERLGEVAAAKPDEEIRVLNLFAYTGGSTLASAKAGAQVVHVDASKTTVTWARENAVASGLGEAKIRWIIEDVSKFVEREERRGTTYHGIILDPPSYGRGPKGQLWQIETELPALLARLKTLLDPDFRFVLLSAHSQGYTPIALENLLRDIIPHDVKGSYDAGEMMIASDTRPLPSGASCWFVRDK